MNFKKLLTLGLSLMGCQTLSVSGNGIVTTTAREVPAFTRISIQSGITAHATTGQRSLSVKADENLQGLIETFVDHDTLVVRLRPMTWLVTPATLEASISNDLLQGVDASGAATVTLSATPTTRFNVTASGASEVTVDGLSSTELNVTSTGGSTVNASGAASRAAVIASGSSDVELKAVPLETLQVDASGASSVHARVSAQLTGTASGASELTIVGSPSNHVQTSGASSVHVNAN